MILQQRCGTCGHWRPPPNGIPDIDVYKFPCVAPTADSHIGGERRLMLQWWGDLCPCWKAMPKIAEAGK